MHNYSGGYGRTTMRDSFRRRAPYEPIKGRPKVIAYSTFRYATESGKEVIRHHTTDIIIREGGKVRLFTGGYRSTTTRARFREYGPNNVSFITHKGDWWIAYYGSNCPCTIYTPFREGIVVPDDVLGDP